MSDDSILRKQLVELLTGAHAHAGFHKALFGLDPALRGRRPGPGAHSIYEELEHLRLAQEDILRYTLDARWRSPEFPKGYWPDPAAKVTETRWANAVDGWRLDLSEVCALAEDTSRDLTDAIPHGEGRTYLRQILLVADHNAYHTAQIVAIRKLLGNWAD